ERASCEARQVFFVGVGIASEASPVVAERKRQRQFTRCIQHTSVTGVEPMQRQVEEVLLLPLFVCCAQKVVRTEGKEGEAVPLAQIVGDAPLIVPIAERDVWCQQRDYQTGVRVAPSHHGATAPFGERNLHEGAAVYQSDARLTSKAILGR